MNDPAPAPTAAPPNDEPVRIVCNIGDQSATLTSCPNSNRIDVTDVDISKMRETVSQPGVATWMSPFGGLDSVGQT